MSEEQNEQKQQRRVMPESDLELNYHFTNPQWGDDTVNVDLQNQLTKDVIRQLPVGHYYTDPKTQEQKISDGSVKYMDKKNLWANLSYLTRDIRLANYGGREYTYCAYFYELAGHFLNEGFTECCAICIQMAAIHSEMSQGKGGFLRKIQNTLIKEERTQPLETRKNSVLSGQGGKNG